MKALYIVLAALAFLAGVYFFYRSFTLPSGFMLSSASAIQASQVYDMATYYGVLAVGAFVAAGVLVLASHSHEADRSE